MGCRVWGFDVSAQPNGVVNANENRCKYVPIALILHPSSFILHPLAFSLAPLPPCPVNRKTASGLISDESSILGGKRLAFHNGWLLQNEGTQEANNECC